MKALLFVAGLLLFVLPLNLQAAKPEIKTLKTQLRANPNNAAIMLQLTKAYNSDNNPLWAQRTLQRFLARHPDHCTARSWLVWLLITQGNLELADEFLEEKGCPLSKAEQTRWGIYQLWIKRLKKDPSALPIKDHSLNQNQIIFPEDLLLLRSLQNANSERPADSLTLQAEVWGGYTSNARAGAPSDPSETFPASPMTRFALYSEYIKPSRSVVQPLIEVALKGVALSAEDARALNYLELSARPGIRIGKSWPKLTLAYHADLLVLADSEKRYFYESHRAETEMEPNKNITFFAGTGNRKFRESGRNRLEMDGGVGINISPLQKTNLLFVLAARNYDALGDAYDLEGVTLLGVARYRLRADLTLRLGLTLSRDSYRNSGGDTGKLAFGTSSKRLDEMLKLSSGLSYKLTSSVRLEARYDYSQRDSTANLTTGLSDYSYIEHRFLVGLKWSFRSGAYSPEVSTPDGHVAIDYGLDADEESMDDERIQDLLRQDEAARRGSSCVD
ncbi:outer membrane beta-barrel protein [Myxococcota bacterium]|nr:outer membrane beta-barrel protein [Myxococcota bacterium]